MHGRRRWTKETTKTTDSAHGNKQNDNLDFQRAVQACLLALAPVNMVGIREGLIQCGPANVTIPTFDTRMDSRSLFLTALNELHRTGLADNGLLTLPSHELGHLHLVHERVGVSHAGGDAFAGLVPAARGVGQRNFCAGRKRRASSSWPSSCFWCPTKPNHRTKGGARP
jgi:hypothetical protein